jgi:hypothetical protein
LKSMLAAQLMIIVQDSMSSRRISARRPSCGF